jgi:uncharacterized UPF0160 family protein
MTTIEKIDSIYTHAGVFHADEVFACAIMREILPYINIIRGYDAPVDAHNIMCIDLGRKYDFGMINFDHHQGSIKRLDGYPLASAGLVWMHFGKEYIQTKAKKLNEDQIDDLWQRMDDALFKGIDAFDADNECNFSARCCEGKVEMFNLSNVISSYNDNSTKANSDIAFFVAVSFAQHFIASTLTRQMSIAEDARKFEAITKQVDQSGHVMLLKEGIAWTEPLLANPGYHDIRFVITPGERTEWFMRCVPYELGSRVNRTQLLPPDDEWVKNEFTDPTDFIHQGKWCAASNTLSKLFGLAHWSVAYEESLERQADLLS